MSYEKVLLEEERVGLKLRALYRQYGYRQYRMSKFEEYDLYVRNKDFLQSDAVITFTDQTGRLLALKPDVTLSIIKNTRDDDGLKKLYYDEKVYRPAGTERAFREINQVGLECIGPQDDCVGAEVLSLAGESLAVISSGFRLVVSHLGILSSLLEETGLSQREQWELHRRIAEKNRHELAALLEAYRVPRDVSEKILYVSGLHGHPRARLPELRERIGGPAVEELSAVLAPALDCPWSDRLVLDFSGVSDLKYYNGLMLTGYLRGIPAPVLSGGRYDPLLRRLGRKSGGIGFAVYLDLLERLEPEEPFRVETLLLYTPGEDPVALAARVRELQAGGARVLALPRDAQRPPADRVLLYEKGRVEACE